MTERTHWINVYATSDGSRRFGIPWTTQALANAWAGQEYTVAGFAACQIALTRAWQSPGKEALVYRLSARWREAHFDRVVYP